MNAAELPDRIRAFVAIFATEAIVAQLETVQKRLHNAVGQKAVRWTKPEQIHLTLEFLGPVERPRLAEFESAMGLIVQRHPTFQLRSEAIGCFPNTRRPRVIWAGLTGETNSLKHLKEDLDSAFTGLGYVPEKRSFHPHFTIGRVTELKLKDAKRLVQEISKCDSERFGEWNVTEIHLMQSVLSPKGAEYRVLKSFPLGNI